MSTYPGDRLEDLLMWDYNLTVQDEKEACISTGLAEVFGTVKKRPVTSKETFAKLVALYEPLREEIEETLDCYDYEYSWRDFAGCHFDCVTDEMWEKGLVILGRKKVKR